MDVITDRERSVTEVLTACRAYAAMNAAELEKLLAPELAPGERMPDLVLLHDLFGRALARRWRRLLAAAEKLLRSGEDHRRQIAERAGGVEVLYREVVELRAVLRHLAGGDSRDFLGLRGETSRDPTVLLRQADRAVARLRDFSRESPVGEKLSTERRESFAAPVAAAAEDLRSARKSASTAGKGVDGARADRRRALADLNTVFVHVAGWLAATCQAAGRDNLAAKIRPSRKYLGCTQREVRRRAARRAGSARPPSVERADSAVQTEAPAEQAPAAAQVADSDPAAASTPILRRALRLLASGRG